LHGLIKLKGGIEMQEEIKEVVVNRFPAIILGKDEQLELWFFNTEQAVREAITTAQRLVIADDITMQTATDLKRAYKQGEKDAAEKIKPFKDRINDIKKQILDAEKALTVEGFKFAADIVMEKINARVNFLEAEKRKEEARLRELAEKDRQKRLDSINGALDKLLEKQTDLTAQRQSLEDRIQAPDITEEEADIIRTRIEAIDRKLGQVSQRVETKQIAMEEVAAPMTVSVQNFEKPKGMSSSIVYEVQEIHNPKAVLRAIIEGTLSIACVTFNTAKIKQAANDSVKGTNVAPNIPGVTFIAKRDTRIR
jgi:DNA repair exonuclease SbcCD ATPase subunit